MHKIDAHLNISDLKFVSMGSNDLHKKLQVALETHYTRTSVRIFISHFCGGIGALP